MNRRSDHPTHAQHTIVACTDASAHVTHESRRCVRVRVRVHTSTHTHMHTISYNSTVNSIQQRHSPPALPPAVGERCTEHSSALALNYTTYRLTGAGGRARRPVGWLTGRCACPHSRNRHDCVTRLDTARSEVRDGEHEYMRRTASARLRAGQDRTRL